MDVETIQLPIALLEKMTPADRAMAERLMKEASEPSPYRITLRDLMIQDLQTGALIPFYDAVNHPQRSFLQHLSLLPSADFLPDSPRIGGKRLRVRTLKARREGITTMVAAIYFLDTVNNHERMTVEVAHTGDAAQDIFVIYQRFYQHLPEHKKPKAQRSQGTELFWPELNSRIVVASAESVNIKSGATIHNLHKSEYAKWKGDVTATDASLNIAAMYGNIIEETTAQGFNHFAEKWKEKDGYKRIFLPWFADPRNQTPTTPLRDKKPDEVKKQQAYNLTDAQLAWYRERQSEYKKLTPQEFPHNPTEAFVASGGSYFDTDVLTAWQEMITDDDGNLLPLYSPRDNIRFDGVRQPHLHQCSVLEQIKIWEVPDAGLHYIVGCDPMGGNPAGRKDLDNCSIRVLCVETREVVATLCGQWEQHITGRILAELGWWYNTALIGVLSHNHGHSVLNTLLNEQKYPPTRGDGHSGVYHFDPKHARLSKRQQEPTVRQPGWPENPLTKPLMLSILGRMISDKSIFFYDLDDISELLSYQYLEDGTLGAPPGQKDDRVSSFAVAARLLELRFETTIRQMPQETKPVVLWDNEEEDREEAQEWQGWNRPRRRTTR